MWNFLFLLFLICSRCEMLPCFYFFYYGSRGSRNPETTRSNGSLFLQSNHVPRRRWISYGIAGLVYRCTLGYAPEGFPEGLYRNTQSEWMHEMALGVQQTRSIATVHVCRKFALEKDVPIIKTADSSVGPRCMVVIWSFECFQQNYPTFGAIMDAKFSFSKAVEYDDL